MVVERWIPGATGGTDDYVSVARRRRDVLLRRDLACYGLVIDHAARGRSTRLWSPRRWRRFVIELEGFEEFVELIACVVALHALPHVRSVENGRSCLTPSIVPRMALFLSIRIAEPWTATSLAIAVVLGVSLASLVLWLAYRS